MHIQRKKPSKTRLRAMHTKAKMGRKKKRLKVSFFLSQKSYSNNPKARTAGLNLNNILTSK